MNTTDKINQLLNEGVTASFAKFHGMEQDDVNDYTRGAIQTANALMPVIAQMILLMEQDAIKFRDWCTNVQAPYLRNGWQDMSTEELYIFYKNTKSL